MPATVGYQPTLTTEVAELEDRILSTRDGAILNHLDTTVILSRDQASSCSATSPSRFPSLPNTPAKPAFPSRWKKT